MRKLDFKLSSHGIHGYRVTVLRIVLAFAAMALFCGVPMAGAALDPDNPPNVGMNGRPLNYSADSVSLDLKKNLIILTGNANIEQGRTVIVADNAQIFATRNASVGPTINSDNVEKFIANGNVRIELETGVATADKVVYLKETKLLELSGAPAKFVGGDNTMTGTITARTITVDHENGDRLEANDDVRIELEHGVATSDKAVYFTDTKKLVLSGTPAKLVGGDDTISGTNTGSTITVDQETGMVSIENAKGNIFLEDDL